MRSPLKSCLAIATLFLVAPFANAQASTWTIDPDHSTSEFKIRHLGVSNVHGSISKISGTVIWDEKNISSSSVTATIDATTINTNVDDRNKHLKSPDFFDVAKYPTITFKSTAVTGAPGSFKITGDLIIHGVTKSITLDVDGPTPPQTVQGKTVCGFSAKGKVKRADFGLGAKFPAAMIGEDADLTIDLEVDKK